MFTTQQWGLISVIACAVGVVLGMFAQSWRYRSEIDALWAFIDTKLGITPEPEDSTPMPVSVADLDPRNHVSTTPGLDAREAELTMAGFPGTGTHDGIPVITDATTREDVGLPTGDTVEGRVVDAGALWPSADTLTPADAGDFPDYNPWGPRSTAEIVAEIEQKVIADMKQEKEGIFART